MKAKRFSEEQIIGVLKEAEAGANTKDLCRRHGISEATFYNWKAKYAGVTVSEARWLKELEQENVSKRPGNSSCRDTLVSSDSSSVPNCAAAIRQYGSRVAWAASQGRL